MFQVFHLGCICCYGSTRSFKCFICFVLMLQAFYLDVAKVDPDIAYIAMPIHACFKCLFIYFQTYVANVSSECFKGDRDVARCQWMANSGRLLCAGAQPWVDPRGFPCGRGPATDIGAARDANTGRGTGCG
jgi:hypothetical protein